VSPVAGQVSPAVPAGPAATSAAERGGARALERAGVGMFLAIVLMAINLRTIVVSLAPVVEDVRSDLGLSGAVGGLLTTLPVLCFGLLAPLAPVLARRIPIERLVVACGLLTAGAAALRGAGGVAPLFAGSLLAGAGIALAQAVLPMFVRTRFPAQAGSLMGAFTMSLTLGGTIAAGATVPLERLLDGGWATGLAVWAVPAALTTLLWLPAALGPGTLVRGAAPPALLRRPLAWAVALFFGMQSLTFYAGLAWLPSILRDAGYDAGEAGALLALSALPSLLPAFLIPVLAARRSRQSGLLVGCVALTLTAVIGLLVAPGAAPLWMVVLGFGQGGTLGLGLILPVLRSGDAATVASLTAMTFCVGYLLAATGPALLGAVHDLSDGWTAPLVLLCAIAALQLVPGLPASRDRTLATAGAA
jgi:CP family cyanate transporter-like MFS transporter